MPTTLTEPWSSTMTGAVIACAATGMARAGPSPVTATRQPGADGVTPRAGEQQQAEGGQRRQREAERPGQPRVDDEHHDDRGAEHRRACRASRPAQPEQPDRAHHGGAHDARLGPREHDEPGETDQCQHRPKPSWHADQDAQPEDQAGDDGDVAAAHGGQVGHPGRAHRGGEVGGGAAGVTDDQAGEQPARVGGRVLDRRAQAGAQPLGCRGHQPRACQHLGRPADRQGRDPVVCAVGGAEPPVDANRGPPAGLRRSPGHR